MLRILKSRISQENRRAGRDRHHNDVLRESDTGLRWRLSGLLIGYVALIAVGIVLAL